MHEVFKRESTEELYVRLSDGRLMPLENIVTDYERLLNEQSSKKETMSESELKVGKWFRIDREVINKSKEEIRRKCHEAGDEGKAYWKRFEESNKIADEYPNQYPRLIKTYIFEHDWKYRTEQEMRDMCEEIGDGQCDEIICDLELQMRICNGKAVDDLFKKADKLPCVRIIKLRNGGTGYFGGGAGDIVPPATLVRRHFGPDAKHYDCTTYAFRRVFLEH